MDMEEFVFARPPNELSCVIGSLFTELEAPCEHIAHEDELVLCGTTFSGGKRRTCYPARLLPVLRRAERH